MSSTVFLALILLDANGPKPLTASFPMSANHLLFTSAQFTSERQYRAIPASIPLPSTMGVTGANCQHMAARRAFLYLP